MDQHILDQVKKELRQAWYDENNRDTSKLSPRDIGMHVGTKIGLLKAINILDKHVREILPEV